MAPFRERRTAKVLNVARSSFGCNAFDEARKVFILLAYAPLVKKLDENLRVTTQETIPHFFGANIAKKSDGHNSKRGRKIVLLVGVLGGVRVPALVVSVGGRPVDTSALSGAVGAAARSVAG